MGPQRYFPPFSLLFLASKLQDFKNRNLGRPLFVDNYKDHSYPAHMGFFHMLGIDYGRNMGGASGNEGYLPITLVKREYLYQGEEDRFVELGDLIQRHADKIAFMLSRDESGKSDFFNVVSYSLREIFRKVFEHSEAKQLFYCAQYWPKSNKVEVSISDSGMGIRRALAENLNFAFASDKEALENNFSTWSLWKNSPTASFR
jgi:hypothetical protein